MTKLVLLLNLWLLHGLQAETDKSSQNRSLRQRSTSPNRSLLTREEICPLDRTYPPKKYAVVRYQDPHPNDHVEDDLGEISSLGFASYTDNRGRNYAYVVSDKEQYSLKVVRLNTPSSNGGETSWTGNAPTVAVYTLLVDYSNDDWEDLSLGPCSDETDETCIYVGNFGNNKRNNDPDYVPRHKVKIFKFPEPLFTGPGNTPVSQYIQPSTIQFSYETNDFSTYDAEAMFVDWTGAYAIGKGDIYILLKGDCGRGVQKLPVSLHRDLVPGQVVTEVQAQMVMEDPPKQLDYSCHDNEFDVWQGADMNKEGTLIAMITQGYPSRVYFFPRPEGTSVADALASRSCDFVSSTSSGLANEKRFEAVAFVDDKGQTIAEISECEDRQCRVPMYVHNLVLPDSVPISTQRDTPPTEGWIDLSYDSFEDGSLGNYKTVRNGSYNTFPTSLHACDGRYSVEIRDGRDRSSSIFHSSDLDCSPYSMLKVSFQFELGAVYHHMSTLFLELSLNGGSG